MVAQLLYQRIIPGDKQSRSSISSQPEAAAQATVAPGVTLPPAEPSAFGTRVPPAPPVLRQRSTSAAAAAPPCRPWSSLTAFVQSLGAARRPGQAGDPASSDEREAAPDDEKIRTREAIDNAATGSGQEAWASGERWPKLGPKALFGALKYWPWPCLIQCLKACVSAEAVDAAHSSCRGAAPNDPRVRRRRPAPSVGTGSTRFRQPAWTRPRRIRRKTQF